MDKVGQDSRCLDRNLKLDVQKIKPVSVRFVNAGHPLFRRMLVAVLARECVVLSFMGPGRAENLEFRVILI